VAMLPLARSWNLYVVLFSVQGLVPEMSLWKRHHKCGVHEA
jgi:hypothetical protein